MASLPGWFNFNAFTDAGAIAASYRLYTFTAGTTTHLAAYTNSAGTTAHTYVSDGAGGQYIALNSRGELPAPLFLGTGSYDIRLNRPDGTTVWTREARGAADYISGDTSGLRSELADVTTAGDGDALVGYGAIVSIVDGVLTRHASLAAAVTTIGSTRCTVIVRDDVTMAANATFPSTAVLHIQNRAQIATTGYTLTAVVKAERRQCFAGSGTVTLLAGSDAPSPLWFGAVSDGTTDDATAWQRAMATGAPVIDCRGLNSRIGSSLTITGGMTVLLSGTTISIASSTLTVFAATNVDNWSLVGPFKITGGGSTSGTAKGVSVAGGLNWRVRDYTAESIQGHGFYLVPGTSSERSNHGYISNFRAISCYRGWEDTPGTGAEYSTLESPYIKGCNQEGMITAAGNTIVFGGQILECDVGVRLKNGSNHGHGAFVGTNINHHTSYAIWADSVTLGHDFIGCHIYAGNASGQGAIFLDKSKGIVFTGGHLDCWLYNYKDGSSGINVIDGMYLPNSYGVARLNGSNDGHDQLIIRNCYGPGVAQQSGGRESAGFVINDPSTCYAMANRVAAATQSLTSGVAATLTFSSSPPFPDRRGVVNTSTGSMTIPAALGGLYRVSVNLLFGGTSMDAANSFVEIRVGGVTKEVFFGHAYSTSKVSVVGSADILLSAADVVTAVATITGTTPSFGDGTWPSKVTLEKIA